MFVTGGLKNSCHTSPAGTTTPVALICMVLPTHEIEIVSAASVELGVSFNGSASLGRFVLIRLALDPICMLSPLKLYGTPRLFVRVKLGEAFVHSVRLPEVSERNCVDNAANLLYALDCFTDHLRPGTLRLRIVKLDPERVNTEPPRERFKRSTSIGFE